MADHNRPRVKSEVYYWDVGTLSWIPGVQGSGGGGGGDASAANQTTEIAHLATIDTSTSSINANTPTLGQKVMSGSTPVVLASDHTAIAVTSTTNLNAIAGTPITVGQGASTGNTPRVTIATNDTVTVSVNNLLGQTKDLNSGFPTAAVPYFILGTATGGGPTQAAITGNPLAVKDEDFITLMEFDGSNNPIYIGRAYASSATSSAVWQIKRIDWTGSNPTAFLYGNGSADFTAAWDDRAILSYA